MKCRECKKDISSMLPKNISKEEVKFCPNCGKNFRYECPICHKTTITIMGIDNQKSSEIRCPKCNSLFYVCKKCGRLEEPKQIYCQECGERGGVLVSHDLSSDTYNGTGFCDNATIKLSPNQEDTIETTDKYIEIEDCYELHSAKILGGYLFIWHDSTIEIFDINSDFENVKTISTDNVEKSTISPCMALLGDNIIIATKEKFLWYTLSGSEFNIENYVKGKPMALISGHHGIAMWTEDKENKIHLYTSLCPSRSHSPIIKEITLKEGQELFRKTYSEQLTNTNYLAMSKTKLYWQGESKNIYEYDFLNNLNEPSEIKFEHGEIFKIWTDNFDRVSVAVVDKQSNKLSIYDNLLDKEDNSPKLDKSSISNLYIYKEKDREQYAYIISNQIMKNGQAEVKADGEHIHSIFLNDKDNNKLVLLSLFNNNNNPGTFYLYTQEKDSNFIEEIFKSNKIIPIKLLCYKDKIFVLHKKGIVVLERYKDNSSEERKEIEE